MIQTYMKQAKTSIVLHISIETSDSWEDIEEIEMENEKECLEDDNFQLTFPKMKIVNSNIFTNYRALREFCTSKANYRDYPIIPATVFYQFHDYLQRSRDDLTNDSDDIYLYDPEFKLPENLCISKRSFFKLNANEWYNDEIINSYIDLLQISNQENGENLKFMFKTYFFQQMLIDLQDGTYNFSKYCKIIAKKNPEISYITYFIPVNYMNHWSLIEMNMTNHEMIYYDSMGNFKNGECLMNILSKFFFDLTEYSEKIRVPISFSYALSPYQSNFNDCGVFLCKFLHFLSSERGIAFTDSDIPYFRLLIGCEIMLGYLLSD